MKRIKTGDEVVVIAGKDKGREGRVLRVLADDRVVVENVNVVKRHTRGNPASGQAGGIVEQERSIHISNVMIRNPQSGKPERIGYKLLADGRKVRFLKSNGEVFDV
ncbi:50S ribosomal protein L24 [Candidatus Macondimonas diazotrophica]|jgi:large subunit ribosomal protein L24|uniref:Large ribosomal subunit protein uL24 n=1 Tax=Candidatus Macondimonas diazotrophica TaxID=2305248 RepID=A0A4Z0F8T4_9GAMM|nr:50S ribosomal protein L24 [Candidatus Macondimonas diazotrophica]MDY6955370.1 50S ribosomal protein L24 [Pseudomonadota bacterium]HBG31376.1 50S ribosomal protein L24 [Gammaproteobacteria bacterium]NCU01399.1 50S ribosomal protein L24 [Candidatus Macondimonas diazotrophica]TFZ81966.1 50S ribosomal protein L24 [Candidatus Macondimonas diazotrophica]HBG51183.1 50S ribosomal protein L24 [Gammaproteobacteria bacterium]